MMILEAGTVVHEWYRDGDPAFARDVASAQKSVLSLIVGRAIDLDVLSLESTIDSVLGSGWATGESATITVEHLLTMTSGLDDLWRVVDEPGRAWRYNSAFAALFDVIESVTARPLNDVAAEWLFEPIGAAGAEFRVRPGAAARARYGLVCTAGQLAAVGAMVLGSGPQQVSRAWLDGSFLPSQPFNPAYGRLWWLNGQSSYLVPEGVEFDGPLVPSAPPDMVAALGKDDQKLYVCPSLDLVVVRLGAKADPDARLALSSFDDDLWQQLIAQRLRAR
jgi:CubicO group peptidase (beta-lactamase class C family)